MWHIFDGLDSWSNVQCDDNNKDSYQPRAAVFSLCYLFNKHLQAAAFIYTVSCLDSQQPRPPLYDPFIYF